MYGEIKKVCFVRNNVINNKVDGLSYTGTLQDVSCAEDQYKLISGATILKHGSSSVNGTSALVLTDLYALCPEATKDGKIILHKRYLQILRDYAGSYGLYGRDMYAYVCKTDEEVDVLAIS